MSNWTAVFTLQFTVGSFHYFGSSNNINHHPKENLIYHSAHTLRGPVHVFFHQRGALQFSAESKRDLMRHLFGDSHKWQNGCREHGQEFDFGGNNSVWAELSVGWVYLWKHFSYSQKCRNALSMFWCIHFALIGLTTWPLLQLSLPL